MKDEDYKFLEAHKADLDRANRDFMLPISSVGRERFRAVYKSITGEDYNLHSGCGHCLLILLKRLNAYYDKEQALRHRDDDAGGLDIHMEQGADIKEGTAKKEDSRKGGFSKSVKGKKKK